jgi:hypothetical protein
MIYAIIWPVIAVLLGSALVAQVLLVQLGPLVNWVPRVPDPQVLQGMPVQPALMALQVQPAQLALVLPALPVMQVLPVTATTPRLPLLPSHLPKVAPYR